jgi:hypothetical protein
MSDERHIAAIQRIFEDAKAALDEQHEQFWDDVEAAIFNAPSTQTMPAQVMPQVMPSRPQRGSFCDEGDVCRCPACAT